MKTASRKYLWICAIAIVILSGWWIYSRSKGGPQYQTASVEKGSVQASISATGNTNAVVTVQVGSRSLGLSREMAARILVRPLDD